MTELNKMKKGIVWAVFCSVLTIGFAGCTSEPIFNNKISNPKSGQVYCPSKWEFDNIQLE